MLASTRSVLISLALGLVCPACVSSWGAPGGTAAAVVLPARTGGPPAHAPAHGYRRKFQQDGVSLQFESGLGVYVVVDLADVFFSDGRYLRFDGRDWFSSRQPRGGWVRIALDDLPQGLRSYNGKGGAKGRGRGRSKR